MVALGFTTTPRARALGPCTWPTAQRSFIWYLVLRRQRSVSSSGWCECSLSAHDKSVSITVSTRTTLHDGGAEGNSDLSLINQTVVCYSETDAAQDCGFHHSRIYTDRVSRSFITDCGVRGLFTLGSNCHGVTSQASPMSKKHQCHSCWFLAQRWAFQLHLQCMLMTITSAPLKMLIATDGGSAVPRIAVRNTGTFEKKWASPALHWLRNIHGREDARRQLWSVARCLEILFLNLVSLHRLTRRKTQCADQGAMAAHNLLQCTSSLNSIVRTCQDLCHRESRIVTSRPLLGTSLEQEQDY